MRTIYLTHLLRDSIDWKAVARITSHALTSVEPGYMNIRAVIGVRRLIPVGNLIFDSGGFAAFTKGISVDVGRTILLYKVVGYDPSTDYLVELDHIPFYVYAGANAIDGVSWRNSALCKELVIPGMGVRTLGSSKRRRLSSEDIDVLRQWWKEPINPFKDMKIEEFLALASRNDTLGFRVRGLWNATALKLEERIANEYTNDPDRYYNYLMKRWRNNNFWRNILKIIRSDYVQSKLTVYLRSSLGG